MRASLLLLALLVPVSLGAQGSRDPQGRTVRAEFGVGMGAVGTGFGPGARVTFVYLPRRWGFWLRQAGHIGKEGPLECTTPTSCSRQRQMFYDSGLMLGTQFFREDRFRVVGGIGIGVFGGRAPSGTGSLESFAELGFPIEVGLYTANRGLLGGGVVLTGNMNGRIAQFGMMVTGSVGPWR